MARRRFFVDAVHRGYASLEGDAAQHLRRVLRVETGQQFEISDNRSVYLAEIDGFGKGRISFRVLETIPAEDPPVRLTLLASLIKFDRFEMILEKATELGVEAIVPVQAERSERGLEKAAAKRLERWRRIVLESSQQSRRVRLPEVAAPKPFQAAIQAGGSQRYFLEEQSNAAPILTALPEAGRRQPSDEVGLLVGPEGGWTDEERRSAVASGWQPVSLGPQILRAETAAMAGLAVIGNAWHARLEDAKVYSGRE